VRGSPLSATEPPSECDVAVVGAGIIGLAVARELALRRGGRKVVVLEREPTIARHQTGHASGVIHSGIYYTPGSLKADLCVAGARELYAFCKARGIPARRIGKLIVATDDRELPRLAELERRGQRNGVPGLRRLDRGEIAEVEPHAVGVAALHSPSTGVVDYVGVAEAFAADLAERNGFLVTGRGVEMVKEGGGEVLVRHAPPPGDPHAGPALTRASTVVVCAGLWSDRLAVAAGAPSEPRIVPFRGAYLRLQPERRDLVRTNIYPVPDPELPALVPTIESSSGNCVFSPSAGRNAAPARSVPATQARAVTTINAIRSPCIVGSYETWGRR
jgi:(S)-2-hydroxyglutarate dehydrogenase